MGNSLHVGCGGDIKPGYINIDLYSARAEVKEDILTLDYNKYKPIDLIESHHVFEHFSYVNSFVLLIKWISVINLGKTIRIDIPDTERLCRALDSKRIKQMRGIMRLVFGSHEGEWAYHINGWNKELLSDTMQKLGCKTRSCREYGGPQSDFPHMGIEMDFVKVTNISIYNMKARALKMLDEYTHPNEHQLRELFHKQLNERLS